MHKQDTNTQAIGHHTKAVKLLHVSKDLDGALKALNRAIELAPRAPGLRMDRGLVYRKLGRWSDAIQDYADARSLEEKLAQQAMVEKSFRQSPNRMARRPTTSAGLGGGGRGGVAASSLAERMEARIKGTSPEPADGGRASASESNSVLEAAAATDADELEARARSGKAARGVRRAAAASEEDGEGSDEDEERAEACSEGEADDGGEEGDGEVAGFLDGAAPASPQGLSSLDELTRPLSRGGELAPSEGVGEGGEGGVPEGFEAVGTGGLRGLSDA